MTVSIILAAKGREVTTIEPGSTMKSAMAGMSPATRAGSCAWGSVPLVMFEALGVSTLATLPRPTSDLVTVTLALSEWPLPVVEVAALAARSVVRLVICDSVYGGPAGIDGLLVVDLPPEEALKVTLEAPYTRYPVYRETIDNVIGTLHVRDLFQALHDRGIASVDLEAMLRAPYVVPETKDRSLEQIQSDLGADADQAMSRDRSSERDRVLG